MNVLLPSLKYSSLKHLWYLMSLGETSNKTGRNTKTEKIVKHELGHESYILKDKKEYIVATAEIEGAHGLPRDTNTISDELQQVLHGVDPRDAKKKYTGFRTQVCPQSNCAYK